MSALPPPGRACTHDGRLFRGATLLSFTNHPCPTLHFLLAQRGRRVLNRMQTPGSHLLRAMFQFLRSIG